MGVMKRDTDRQVLQTDRQTDRQRRQVTKSTGRQTGFIDRKRKTDRRPRRLADRQALYREGQRETDRHYTQKD